MVSPGVAAEPEVDVDPADLVEEGLGPSVVGVVEGAPAVARPGRPADVPGRNPPGATQGDEGVGQLAARAGAAPQDRLGVVPRPHHLVADGLVDVVADRLHRPARGHVRRPDRRGGLADERGVDAVQGLVQQVQAPLGGVELPPAGLGRLVQVGPRAIGRHPRHPAHDAVLPLRDAPHVKVRQPPAVLVRDDLRRLRLEPQRVDSLPGLVLGKGEPAVDVLGRAVPRRRQPIRRDNAPVGRVRQHDVGRNAHLPVSPGRPRQGQGGRRPEKPGPSRHDASSLQRPHERARPSPGRGAIADGAAGRPVMLSAPPRERNRPRMPGGRRYPPCPHWPGGMSPAGLSLADCRRPRRCCPFSGILAGTGVSSSRAAGT